MLCVLACSHVWAHREACIIEGPVVRRRVGATARGVAKGSGTSVTEITPQARKEINEFKDFIQKG